MKLNTAKQRDDQLLRAILTCYGKPLTFDPPLISAFDALPRNGESAYEGLLYNAPMIIVKYISCGYFFRIYSVEATGGHIYFRTDGGKQRLSLARRDGRMIYRCLINGIGSIISDELDLLEQFLVQKEFKKMNNSHIPFVKDYKD